MVGAGGGGGTEGTRGAEPVEDGTDGGAGRTELRGGGTERREIDEVRGGSDESLAPGANEGRR